jgi:Type I restriction modification DNA specificity domain.
MPISLPLIAEQKNIGAFFSKLDNLITLHQRAQWITEGRGK